MPTTRPPSEQDPETPTARLGAPSETAPTGSVDFRESFGEELQDVLDVSTWRTGWDLSQEYLRVEQEVRQALADEDDLQRRTRERIFPRLFDPAVADGRGGVSRANPDVIRLIHGGLLFNGAGEACDGASQWSWTSSSGAIRG
jgi:hypothetical protein